MQQIQIENPHLRSFIRKKLDLPKYAIPTSNFDKVVEELLVRYQYVLDLSPEEFMEDLENLKSSLKTIKFSHIKGHEIAFYSPTEKSITLSSDYFDELLKSQPTNDYYNYLLETLFHELLHSTQTKKNGYNRAEVYNTNLKNRGHALYEIATEGISIKCTSGRSQPEMRENRIQIGNGYSNELFAIPLLAATFGVSEQTILKYGVRQRAKLIKVCNVNIGDISKTEELLFRMENELETIHSIYYPDNNQKEFIKMSPKEKAENAKAAYINLIKICNEAMAERIIHLPSFYDKDKIIQLKYDQKKLMGTVDDENIRYGNYFNLSQYERRHIFNYDTNFQYFTKSLTFLSELGETKNRDLMNNSPEIIASIKNGSFDSCRKYGLIEPPQMSNIKNTNSFLDDIIHIDYNDFLNWDNYVIFNCLGGNSFDYTPPKKISPELVHNATMRSDYHLKMNDLRIALLAMDDKYYTNSKFALSQIISYKTSFDETLYNFFTKDIPEFDKSAERISPRERMQRSFNTDEDRVFLADIIARNFINTAFSPDSAKNNFDNESLEYIKTLLTPTISEYGHEQTISILKDIILNDYYSRIHGEEEKNKMAILGKKQITDIIIAPMLQSVLNKRKIIPEKKRALQYAIVKTNDKFPNTIHSKLAKMVSDYKNDRYFNYTSITIDNYAREIFSNSFSSPKDMEDLIGFLCDSYSSQNYFRRKDNDPLQQMLNKCGPDYFRENIIRTQLYNDYTGLLYPEHRETLEHVDCNTLIEQLSIPFINESIQSNYYDIRKSTFNNPVTRSDLMEMVQKPTVIQNIRNVFSNLWKKVFGNPDNPKRSNVINKDTIGPPDSYTL